jgi:uncharacterized damage-inducible protein DinB
MDLSYPIGRFTWEGPSTPEQRMHFINEIAATPGRLYNAVAGLSSEQLEAPYRPGGWTVRQVVHHVPDSHLNSYMRFKFALTEDQPTIKAYDEARWAELEDSRSTPIDVSIALLDALHQRWTTLLRSLSQEDYLRTFQHPEIGVVSLDRNLALYAWHGAHHVAHITSLRERMGWS